MKRSISFFLLTCMMVAGYQNASAQYITIPDPNFVSWMNANFLSGCLNGNQLDTTCPAVTNGTTVIACDNWGISDLTGIEVFNNLQTLQCTGNQLTTLPDLPASVIQINCTENQITSLPNLPPALKNLFCAHNQLSSFPILPATLQQLDCSYNLFSGLPVPPASVKYLDCSHNQLTALPGFAVETLYCDNNQLAVLPPLISPLKEFHCRNNLLTSLPALPASLLKLECDSNQLTSLPALPDALTLLFCRKNQLTSLPSLPPDLNILLCEENQLTILPTLPSTLEILTCQDNQLTELPTLPAGVDNLICSHNQLTSLPGLPLVPFALDCSNNQLTDLPALPNAMVILNISNNPGILCLPPIEFITGAPASSTIAGTGITCLPNHISHSGSIPSIDNKPLCNIFNPNGCEVAWNVTGTVYIDNNGDCIPNNGEFHPNNIKLELLQAGIVVQQVFANNTGDFSFDTDLGAFEVRVDTTGLPFTVICPTSNIHSSNITAVDSFDTAAKFGFECPTGFDLAISSVVNDSGMFFPTNFAKVIIDAGDAVQFFGATCNTTGLGGLITATISGPVTVASASANGLVTGSTVAWTINDFAQLDPDGSFSVILITDTFPVQGAQVCVEATIGANTGNDNDSSNNILTQCFDVVNSFDPNDKQVFPAISNIPGQWHTYTIRFQNTGTAAAQNILVKDTLDSNLDWGSFQLLTYSHDNLTQVKENGIVHFNFPNINLPDSTSNEPESHGYVQYKIKTKSDIQPGTTIHNTAAIYFDFNDPVITNDATVTYCLPTETQQSFDICPGDSVQVGSNVYHQAGTYTNLFTSASGCDSTIVTTVNISGIDTSITVGNASLFANGNATSYQWINCNTSQPIAGETNQTFTPLQNGSYAVELTFGNNCTAVSSCVNVTITGTELIHQGVLNVYPNPSDGNVHFDVSGYQGTLTVYNALGQTLQTIIVNGNTTLKDLPQGLLTYKFVEGNGKTFQGKLAVLN